MPSFFISSRISRSLFSSCGFVGKSRYGEKTGSSSFAPSIANAAKPKGVQGLILKAVADYVHSKGLKFGIYSCCGTHTCSGYPGSFEHEFSDAKQFAQWGVDYLKYYNCYRANTLNTPLLYRRMSMALRSTGREIVLNACQWGTAAGYQNH